MFRRNTHLWSVIVVGAIVTSVGGTGIFAVFTDRATQGPNTIESGPRPRAADIQIGDFVSGTCAQLHDDLTTAIWSVTNRQPGESSSHNFCVKNNGAARATITLTTLDLAESDPQCTGDEQSVDPLCGSGAGQGQLAGRLVVGLDTDADCDLSFGETGDLGGSQGLSTLAGNPAAITSTGGLAAGSTTCLQVRVIYPSSTSVNDAQAAQSDSVSWKFAFDGAAVE
jgi:hypothetical protein